jgi:hypothetical protein
MAYGECLFLDAGGRLTGDTRDLAYHVPNLSLHQPLQFRSVRWLQR